MVTRTAMPVHKGDGSYLSVVPDRTETAGQVATIMTPPSVDVLDSRLTVLEREVARDREEILSRLSHGFSEMKTDIANLKYVHPEVFTAWQTGVDARFQRLDAEVIWNRRLLIGGLLLGAVAFLGRMAMDVGGLI